MMTRWRSSLLACLLLVIPAGMMLAAQPDLLRPEQAFRYALSTSAEEIIVRWEIEPGYYLYRERMSFEPADDSVRFDAPQMPQGQAYSDEFFGDMHIYRHEAVVRIPVDTAPDGPFDLVISSQGCADIGVCYPPQKWQATARLKKAAGSTTPRRSLQALLSDAPTAATRDAPLPPEQAFAVTAERNADGRLRLHWDIAPGYYLYRDSLAAKSATPGMTVATLQLPAGEAKEDEFWGKTHVYYDSAVADAALVGEADTLLLELSYQGCKEDTLCYPPQTLMLTAGPASATLQPTALTAPASGNVMVSEQDRLATMVGNANLFLVMLTFAGLGLLLSFTPCCLPMIPILSGIIVGQGKQVTTLRAFSLSLTYVLGMALTYTIAGAAFAAAGGQIQAALQQPWIIISMAVLFTALALPMFGVFEMQMPAFVMNRVNAASSHQAAGTFFGTAIMGALSALVVTTCVAPPLVAALTVIAQTGDALRGALALFAFAMGMGLPLIAIGTSAGKLLPRAGAWMNTVKGAFGFMMLGLAIWMLGRLLPASLTMVLWAVLIFMAGVFLGAFQPLAAGAPPIHRLAKGSGLLAALYGAVLLIGALAGAHDPFQPLGTLQATSSQAQPRLEFQRVKTISELEQTISMASEAGKPVMLDFYADWCASCIEMERYTFSRPEVQAALADVILLQADVTANDAEDQALLRHFGIFGPPSIMFFGPDGQERGNYRLVGFTEAAAFASHVGNAIGS